MANFGGDMEINLRACNETMSEQIADGDEAHASTYEMSCESVAHAMRGEMNTDATALSPQAHTLIDSAA